MFEALIAEDVTATEDGVTARCGTIVYRVECSHRDADRLSVAGYRRSIDANEPTLVLVQLEMADDTLTLVGFSSAERRKLYRALRAVSGIGRRSALLVLDCGEVIDTLRAVAGADAGYFRGVPGLGKARIGAVIAELHKRYKDAIPSPLTVPVAVWVEARDALVLDGTSLREAETSLRNALDSTSSVPRTAEHLLALATSSAAG